MVFLPGSLISSIFGMGFFSTSSGPEGRGAVFTASDKWWLYFAVAVPLTAAVMVVMIFYQKKNEVSAVKPSKVPLSDSEAQLSDKKQS